MLCCRVTVCTGRHFNSMPGLHPWMPVPPFFMDTNKCSSRQLLLAKNPWASRYYKIFKKILVVYLYMRVGVLMLQCGWGVWTPLPLCGCWGLNLGCQHQQQVPDSKFCTGLALIIKKNYMRGKGHGEKIVWHWIGSTSVSLWIILVIITNECWETI